MTGEFRCHKANDCSLIIFGPKDRAEIKAGVPAVAMAVGDQISFDAAGMARFLNACVKASQGRYEALKAIVPNSEAKT